MHKNFYKKSYGLLGLTLITSTLIFLSACKKDKEAVKPAGISYGITGVEPSMAGVGDTIKIYGEGFQATTNGNTVKINGVTATIVSANSQSLNVIVPAAPRNGNVSVQTGGNSNTYNKNFTVATVITGNQPTSIWTPDKFYLLKGIIHFPIGTKLTIQAGTVILGDKATLASLIIDNGATVEMNGTAAQPIIFSSNQLINFRTPGDWTGITLAPTNAAGTPADIISYVRIEYAGYHISNIPGAALQISRSVKAGNVQHVQVSYSGADGFQFNSGAGTVQYLKYLIAFGCAGNDFTFNSNVRAFGQFLLGIKDPIFADPLTSDGLTVQSTQPVTISNLSLVGPNGLARMISPNYTPYGGPFGPAFVFDDEVMNANAGRGIHVGGLLNNNGVLTPAGGTLQLFNSLIAAPWLAGISFDGPAAWAQYENGTAGSTIRKTSITYNYVVSSPPIFALPPYPPYRGYTFSKENVSGSNIGFERVDGSIQQTTFNKYNDTVKLTLTADPYNNDVVYDDLGIANFALYSKMSRPQMQPLSSSTLLSGADFTPAMLNDPFFDKSLVFRGAFGSADWTSPWANYTPQKTAY